MIIVPMTGAEFRKWRRSQEITQQEIASKVGCNKSTICRWEKNQLILAPNLYEKILKIYMDNSVQHEIQN